jgi:1-acyl-sn-glycerol-3-phosphate acyltransferase
MIETARVRGIARALLLGAWFGVAAVAVCAIETLALVARDRAVGLRAALFHRWSRGAARIVGLRIDVGGAAPTGPFFLVANHLSYLDVIVLGATLRATFVAKADVAAWPLIGWLCSAVGTVFLDRTRRRDLLRVLPLLERRLTDGGGVVVFPEGTTSDGSGVLPFRSSLFAAAVRSGLPVHVATLTYETPAATEHPSRAACWWGDMDFLPHLGALLRLPRCTARLTLVRHPIADTDRKRLARAAHDAISSRFVPVRHEHPTASRGEEACRPVPYPQPPTSTSFAREPIC